MKFAFVAAREVAFPCENVVPGARCRALRFLRLEEAAQGSADQGGCEARGGGSGSAPAQPGGSTAAHESIATFALPAFESPESESSG